MSNLNILRTYAQKPASLPASIKFKETPKNITIFDIYPKSIFHFLVLPRIQPPKLTAGTLNNLQTLLSGDQACAKEVILGLAEDAKTVKEEIQKEMIQRFGFKWDVWIGFHGAPSMSHLHLHIISADLCSEKMKNKKHYNSFHPKLGFFLHIDEVTSWFDADHTFFSTKVKNLKASNYEPILKESLACFHCGSDMKNMPTLKSHLQEEWDKLERRAKQSQSRKRKVEEIVATESTSPQDKDTEEPPEELSEEPNLKRAKSVAEPPDVAESNTNLG